MARILLHVAGMPPSLAIKQDLLLNKTIFLAIYPSGIIACTLAKKRAGNDP
jgi:hypothetical protein